MAIDARFYMHESDKAALQALKAIPGFTQLFKGFLKVWHEKQFRIENMSSNLRVNEKQFPKYYQMLLPICEKLGIDVPELYISLDVNPNSYTYGDTNPFIVITTGMLETVPEDLIPTVLAHECGHIACRHALYTTMGRFVLSEAAGLLKLDGIAMLPIQVAFYYWMRCSEFSADRAAALCDGGAENTVRSCMHLAGYDKDMDGEPNVEEFMNQAMDYKMMVEDSAWDKTMEFLFAMNKTHPLAALRAYECNQWAKTERFRKIANYIRSDAEETDSAAIAFLKEIPMAEPEKYYVGKPVDEVLEQFQTLGFTNVRKERTIQREGFLRPGQVTGIAINGAEGFERYGWYPVESYIVIRYYEPETEEEAAAAHPGQKRMPDYAWRYLGRNYEAVIRELREAGFTNIQPSRQYREKKNWLIAERAVVKITVDGQAAFDKGDWFRQDALILLTYQSYETIEEI